jgi:hypothetical protein
MPGRNSLVRFVLTPIAVAVLMIFAATAFAQTDTGKLSGFVKDQNGAIVPGANITVTDTRTGLERSAKANDDGFFSVAPLKASTYRVIAETTGLSAKVDTVTVNVGQEVALNLAMTPAGVTAQVNVVSGEETLADTGSAAMSANVIPREIQGLPINSRQLSQLYLQAPGSVNSGSGTFGDIAFQGARRNRTLFGTTGLKGRRLSTPTPAI